MRKFAESPPIEDKLGDLLKERGEKISTAESCTGGLAGTLLTEIPGSSDYYDRTSVTYSYGSKMDVLAVERGVLDEYGAVSEPVARQMAEGIRDTSGTTWGVSTTGVAGPDGGTDEIDVGEVYMGVAYAGQWGKKDTYSEVKQYNFDGSRWEIKEKIARQALRFVYEKASTG